MISSQVTDALSALLKLIADPATASATLQEIADAQKKLDDTLAEINAKQAALTRDSAAFDARSGALAADLDALAKGQKDLADAIAAHEVTARETRADLEAQRRALDVRGMQQLADNVALAAEISKRA